MNISGKLPKIEKRIIFIVGNSRSGTTMMGRILGAHPSVFTFHELHFFEQLWSSHERNSVLDTNKAEMLTARLLCIHREGYLTQRKPKFFLNEAKAIIANSDEENIDSSIKVFDSFLRYETKKEGKTIPCEHTPLNVFYIGEILDLYSEARIINMVRDPRDVLLSQKRKWKRRFLGAKSIPLKEAFRSWINYHPITISKFWNAAVNAADKYSENEHVFSLRFEDLIKDPDVYVHRICEFLGLSFDESMLNVPQVGSSSGFDNPGKKGINSDRTGNWRKGGLNLTEIYLCQKITRFLMDRHSYTSVDVKLNYIKLIYYMFSLPIKLLMAFMLNIKRMKNIKETIKKRL